MKRRKSKQSMFLSPFSLTPKMMELSLASWETIARRTMMMVCGTCSPAEYRRMVQEKSDAIRRYCSCALTLAAAICSGVDKALARQGDC